MVSSLSTQNYQLLICIGIEYSLKNKFFFFPWIKLGYVCLIESDFEIENDFNERSLLVCFLNINIYIYIFYGHSSI